MKVVDLQPYIFRRDIKRLEDRVGQLALTPALGNLREMKSCFKEWLKRSQRA